MEDLEKIGLQLKSLHCPMNWKVPESVELTPSKLIDKIERKLIETEEEGIFKWHKLVLTLQLCSEYYKCKQYVKALEKHRQCEAVMNISDSKGYYEKLFHDSKAALFHVLIACECHILYASGETSTLEGKLKEIPKYENMNIQSKATLLGIQSSISTEYGHEGNQIGLKLIEKAVELDPDEGEWQFLLGRCLVRLRHVEDYSSIPSDKELKAFDRAYSITGNPSYLTFMAATLREAADNVRFSTGVYVKEDYERSHSLLKMALEKTGNCSHVLARCAFGFWQLPLEYHDPELAKECYKKALEIAPENIMANHIAGKISYRYDRDYKKAKEYLQKAAEGGAYGAFLDLIRFCINQEEGYDPVPHLEQMLKKFHLEPRLSQTKIQLGAAHLFLKDDLSTALDYWMEVINEYPDTLKQYKCPFIFTKDMLNVYELIINEIRLALKENKANADDKLKFQQALQICIEKQPEVTDLVTSFPQSWKEKFSIRRKRSKHTHVKEKQKDFPRRGNNEGKSNNNWREKISNQGGKNQEFGRAESLNSSCDGEENVYEYDLQGRARARGRGHGRGQSQGFVRNESHSSNCDSEENVPNSGWKGDERTSFQGKNREFGRTESHSSRHDVEENLPESDGRGRGINCKKGKNQGFGKTKSQNSSGGAEGSILGNDWRRNGRNTNGRGNDQEFGRSKSFDSCCDDQNMPGSDGRGRERFRRGRGRSARHKYSTSNFGERDINTNLEGRGSTGLNTTESGIDTSLNRNTSEHYAANSSRGETFNSNRGRGQDGRRNLNSNWRLK